MKSLLTSAVMFITIAASVTAQETAPSTQSAAEPTRGNWQVDTNTDPIDDSQTVILALAADKPVQARWGRRKPIIIVRYKQGKLEAYITFDAFLGTDRAEAVIRWDKNPAKTESWSTSTDYKAMFAPSNSAFVKRLTQHSRLVLQVTPYSDSPVVAEFTLDGFKEAIGPYPKIVQAIAK